MSKQNNEVMSEEEIVQILKNIDGKDLLNCWDYGEKELKAIEGLLDLYQKEKEKNKKLEDMDITTAYLSGFCDGDKFWKNKYIEQVKYGTKISIEGEAVQQIIDIIKKDYISKDKIKNIADKYKLCKIERLKEFYQEIQELTDNV